MDDCNHKISNFHARVLVRAQAAFAELLSMHSLRLPEKEQQNFLSHQEQHQLVATLNASHFRKGRVAPGAARSGD